MIDLNITLLIQLVNFLITLVVLQVLFIGPVREQLRKRKATVNGLSTEISDFLSKAEHEMTGYEAALKSARETAMQQRTTARTEAEIAAQAMLNDASGDAQHTVHLAQNAMRAEMDNARDALHKDVSEFSKLAVHKLLG